MRIILASSGARRVVRGIELWMLALARDLNESGFEVELLVGGRPGAPHERHVPSLGRNHPLLRLVGGPRVWRRRVRVETTTFSLFAVPRLRPGPVLLHVGDPFLASMFLKLRSLGLWRGLLLVSAQTELSERIVRAADAVQALTPEALERFRAVRGGSERLTLIPNYVDPSRFSGERAASRRRLGLAADRYVVLSVGAVAAPYKRMDLLLDEFAAMRSGRETLLIVGAREPSSAAIERRARALGDDVRVYFDEPHERLPDFYAAADCFALASPHETFGIVFLEAMASGLPVVAEDWPATRWIVEGGGLHVNGEHVGAMAAALARLRDDDDERRRLGLAGRQRVSQRFSRHVVVPEMIRFYRDLTGATQPRIG